MNLFCVLIFTSIQIRTWDNWVGNVNATSVLSRLDNISSTYCLKSERICECNYILMTGKL